MGCYPPTSSLYFLAQGRKFKNRHGAPICTLWSLEKYAIWPNRLSNVTCRGGCQWFWSLLALYIGPVCTSDPIQRVRFCAWIFYHNFPIFFYLSLTLTSCARATCGSDWPLSIPSDMAIRSTRKNAGNPLSTTSMPSLRVSLSAKSFVGATEVESCVKSQKWPV